MDQKPRRGYGQTHSYPKPARTKSKNQCTVAQLGQLGNLPLKLFSSSGTYFVIKIFDNTLSNVLIVIQSYSYSKRQNTVYSALEERP